MRGMICNGLLWTFNDRHPDELTQRWATPEALGFLPGFLDADDKRPACEQLDANYGYGGHWRTSGGILPDGTLTYPGDPPMAWAAQTKLRDETVLIYPYAFVAVVQPDKSFLVQRMD